MRILACISFCFFLDYAVESWKVCITQNPTDFLRGLIASGKSIEDPANLERFEHLVEIEDTKARVKFSEERKIVHLKKLEMLKQLKENE